MSYILDALRRAESERANEKKVPGLHDQPLEPLTQPQHSRPAKAPWLWMLAGGGIVLLGALAWVWFARTPDHPGPIGREAAPGVANLAPPPVPQNTRPAGAPVVIATAPTPPQQPVAQEPPPAPAAATATQPPPRVLPPPKPATPEPAPTATAEDAHVPTLVELPDAVRRSLPALHVEAIVYSSDPASRMLMLNGQMLREGEAAGDGLTVERVKPSSAVMNYRGQRFELTRQ